VIVEYDSMGLTLHARRQAGGDWITTALTGDATLSLPEIGVEIPVAELYADTDLTNGEAQAEGQP
jgi:hypothetical protein